jgi:hypothetical protein
MKINKFLLAGLIAVLIPLTGQAAANVDVNSLRAGLQELRGKHADYKAQVASNELTRDDAIALWKTDIETFRAEKDEFFKNKMGVLEGKYNKLAKNNPEKADEIKANFKQKKQQRENRMLELKKGLLERRRSGEMNNEGSGNALNQGSGNTLNQGSENAPKIQQSDEIKGEKPQQSGRK